MFLYDHYDQLNLSSAETKRFKPNVTLEDLFEFGTDEEEQLRKWKYEKFFEALSAMAIIIKFIESDKCSPKVLDLLKFYWAEKLNLTIK